MEVLPIKPGTERSPQPMPAAAPTVPERRGLITVEDVRDYCFDRTAEDNPLELDLFFTDTEIRRAMRFTAMKFNDIPPFVLDVTADALPFSGLFLDGVCASLYLSKYQQLARNLVEYKSETSSVDINARRVEYLEKWMKYFKDEFETKAALRKTTININNGYMSYTSADSDYQWLYQ